MVQTVYKHSCLRNIGANNDRSNESESLLQSNKFLGFFFSGRKFFVTTFNLLPVFMQWLIDRGNWWQKMWALCSSRVLCLFLPYTNAIFHSQTGKQTIELWFPLQWMNCFFKLYFFCNTRRFIHTKEYFFGEQLRCAFPKKKILSLLFFLLLTNIR